MRVKTHQRLVILTLSQFPKDDLLGVDLLFFSLQALGESVWGSETGGELKHSLGRTRKGVTLLPKEHVIVDPVLGEGETFSETSVLESFGKHPRSGHEILSTEVTGDLLVPEWDVTGTIVNDESQLVVVLQRVEQILHPVNTLDQVRDSFLVVLQ